jgi:hypothetical protein
LQQAQQRLAAQPQFDFRHPVVNPSE